MREKGRTAELINKPTAAFLNKIKHSKIDRVACVIKKMREKKHKWKSGMKEAMKP